MSDLKPVGTKIKLGNKEYGMRFTLNVVDEIQEHFKVGIAKIGEIMRDEENGIKNIRYILTLMINEDIDCRNDENESGEKIQRVEEKYVGRHIDMANATELFSKIFETFKKDVPEAEDDSPNPLSGQTKS